MLWARLGPHVVSFMVKWEGWSKASFLEGSRWLCTRLPQLLVCSKGCRIQDLEHGKATYEFNGIIIGEFFGDNNKTTGGGDIRQPKS